MGAAASPVPAAVLALLAAGAGVGLLRAAWRRRRPAAPTLAGWLMILAGAPAWAQAVGWDEAVALAALAPPFFGLALVALNAQRSPRAAMIAASPATSARPARGRRLPLRWSLAAPLPLLAAVSLASAWALKGMGSAADRAAAAMAATPVLWAAGLAWVLIDPRPVRTGAVLAALGSACIAVAAL